MSNGTSGNINNINFRSDLRGDFTLKAIGAMRLTASGWAARPRGATFVAPER